MLRETYLFKAMYLKGLLKTDRRSKWRGKPGFQKISITQLKLLSSNISMTRES
jgi:hypothetical protein